MALAAENGGSGCSDTVLNGKRVQWGGWWKNPSSSVFYFGQFSYCPDLVEAPTYEWVDDTLIIYRWSRVFDTPQCPAPGPVRRERQSSCHKANQGPNKNYGNPTDCSTGFKGLSEVDYKSVDYTLSRDYSGAPGTGWQFSRPYLHVSSVSSLQIAVFSSGRMRKVFVRAAGQTAWQSNRTEDGTLVESSGVVTFQFPSREKIRFDSAGRMATRIQPNGNTVTVAYSGPNSFGGDTETHLTPNGRSYLLELDTNGKLRRFTDVDGKQINYLYSLGGFLERVTYADGAYREYLYEDANHPELVTGVLDELGERFATYSYDPQGRVIGSEHAGGAGRFAFDYPSATTTNVREYRDGSTYSERLITHVTNAMGRRVSAISITSCPGCESEIGSESFSYQATTGRLLEKIDKRGVKTGYSYEPYSGAETQRVEAKGTPQSRTFTTQWNYTWVLPQNVIRPGASSTYYSYTNFGAIALVQDSRQGEGRSTTYSYDANKRLASINGPLSGAADTTQFAYDAQNNLKRVTNAKGHVTEVTQFDPHGNPLVVVDPNGVQTVFTYDLRQRLLSRTYAGATTSFTRKVPRQGDSLKPELLTD